MGCGCNEQKMNEKPKELKKSIVVDDDIVLRETIIIPYNYDPPPGYRIIIDDDGLETFEPIED